MGGLTIRSGGLVEVDPESLRLVAGRLRALAAEVEDARAAVPAGDPAGAAEPMAALGLSCAREALRQGADTAGRLATALESTADLYDAVDALAARELAAAGGDPDAVRRADARLAALVRGDPDALVRALEVLRTAHPHRDLNRQIAEAGIGLGPVLGAFLVTAAVAAGWWIEGAGHGAIPSGQRLQGPAPPVRVHRLMSGPARPPTTLADAAARIPGGGAARVRVERYVTAAGPQFVVYIAGTQSVAGADPFDMTSNLELYQGDASASYQATLAALEAAGARPGDAVHAVGHSQGAMIGERLAAGGPYDVQTVVSFGSPVQADLSAATLAVSVRHTDDPVAALQGGGVAGPVGATGGLVVEREVDPRATWSDVTLAAHQMSAYAETAALIDASEDPRVEGLRAVFDRLGTAEAGSVATYTAARVSPVASGGR